MNKFDAINKVLISDLQAQDKCLLIELIVRADEEWLSWPSVERLCKVRGIKHEKNFKGADVYLPGIVTKSKRGRKNTYTLNLEAIEALAIKEVTIKHTPALTADTPALEGVYTPAQADNTPAVEGANTTYNTTEDNTKETTKAAVSISSKNEVQEVISLNKEHADALTSTTETGNTPATAGVFTGREKAEIGVVVARAAYYFNKEDPNNEYWTKVRDLACDKTFEPETTEPESRVGKAQAAIAPVGADW